MKYFSSININSLIQKNSITSLFFQIFPVITAIICIPLNINHLGLEMWGVYSLSLSLFFLVMYFNFGIGPAVNRILAEAIGLGQWSKEKAVVHTGFFINLAISIILSCVLFLFSGRIINYAIKPLANDVNLLEVEKLFTWIALGSGLYLVISFFRNVMEGRQMFFLVSLLRAIIGSFILIAPLLSSKHNISNSGFYVFVLLSICLLIYILVYAKRYSIPKTKYFDRQTAKLIFSQGWLISLHSFFNPVFIYLDRYIIGNLIGMKVVGIYTSFYDLISRTTIIPSSISSALFPAVSSSMHSLNKTKKITIKTFRLLIIFSGPPFLGLLFFGPYIVNLWLGNDIASGNQTVIQLLVVGYFIQGFNLVFLRYFQAVKEFKFSLYINIGLALLYLPILAVLIHRFGIVGAATVLLFKNIVELMLNVWYFNKL